MSELRRQTSFRRVTYIQKLSAARYVRAFVFPPAFSRLRRYATRRDAMRCDVAQGKRRNRKDERKRVFTEGKGKKREGGRGVDRERERERVPAHRRHRDRNYGRIKAATAVVSPTDSRFCSSVSLSSSLSLAERRTKLIIVGNTVSSLTRSLARPTV